MFPYIKEKTRKQHQLQSCNDEKAFSHPMKCLFHISIQSWDQGCVEKDVVFFAHRHIDKNTVIFHKHSIEWCIAKEQYF